jgi:hypothetical protein
VKPNRTVSGSDVGGVVTSPRRFASTRRSPRQDLFKAFWAAVWLAVVLFSLHIAWLGDHPAALRLVSITSIVFGLWVFLNHGGPWITAAGIYSLGMAVFGGFAGASLAYSTPDAVRWLDLYASLLVLTTHLATWALFWRSSDTAFHSVRHHVDVRREVVRWGLSIGTCLLLFGAALSALGASAGPLPASTAYAGALLAAVSALARGNRRHIHGIIGVAVSGLLFAAYIGLLFTGFGRLVVAGLGTAIVMAGGRFILPRSAKQILLFAIVPALVVFGGIRDTRYDVVRGLGSVTQPLTVFGDVIDESRAGAISTTPGSTFIVAAVAQVPGAWWGSKPEGFGTVLTRHFQPELLRINHSMAALAHGEWWWNFGWTGMIMMVPVIGLALRWLDGRLAQAYKAPLTTRRSLLLLVMTATASAGLLDLFWVGLFTYSARTITTLMVLAIVLSVAGRRRLRWTQAVAA